LHDYLAILIEKEKIEGIFGDPKTLKNEPQKSKIEIEKFKRHFRKLSINSIL
jgi:hypothetical protein